MIKKEERNNNSFSKNLFIKNLNDKRFLIKNNSIGKIFIGINLYQSENLLSDGKWLNTLIELIHFIGINNVYLSIYENNSTDKTPELLKNFSKELKCNHRIITTKINLNENKYKYLYIENNKISRIGYLAMLRNHVLEPLLENKYFSKILFLNDIIFSIEDVINLLQTNNGDYASVCGLDFINPIKFYDTFATRDINGYSMGLPIYPFFASGQTLNEFKQGNQIINVKSCWSGIIVFHSKPFLNGLKFRSLINQTNYEASECCLIHADINQPNKTFINTNVRVAYSQFVYKYQKLFSHFEFLWIIIQKLITFIARLPRYNKYRTLTNDGFCWIKTKMILNTNKHITFQKMNS